MLRARVAVLALATVLAGCGSGGSESDASGAPGEGGGGGRAAGFSAADLDAYERGIRREIELVRAAQSAYDTASTPESRGALQQAQWETATIAEGAKAAALDPERYEEVRRTVHETMRTLDFQGRIEGPLSLDTTRVDEATRARMRADAYGALPPDAAAALRARQDRIAPLWADYTRLVAVAG